MMLFDQILNLGGLQFLFEAGVVYCLVMLIFSLSSENDENEGIRVYGVSSSYRNSCPCSLVYSLNSASFGVLPNIIE